MIAISKLLDAKNPEEVKLWADKIYAFLLGRRTGVSTDVSSVVNPVAGVDWSFTSSPKAALRFNAIAALLTTSAVAGSRRPALEILLPDGKKIWRDEAYATQAANLAVEYYWATSSNGNATAVVSHGVVPFWPFPGGAQVRVVTAAIQTGDQWSNIRLVSDSGEF